MNHSFLDRDYSDEDFEVKVSEMLVATADDADEHIDESISDVLKLLRKQLSMDVVFVSEFADGRRWFRHVEQTPGREVIAQGASDPVEQSWCQRVVAQRLPEFVPDAGKLQAEGKLPPTPFPIGTHISTPIVLKNGEVYGTLCCFSFEASPRAQLKDLNKLRFTAKMAADRLEEKRGDAQATLGDRPA